MKLQSELEANMKTAAHLMTFIYLRIMYNVIKFSCLATILADSKPLSRIIIYDPLSNFITIHCKSNNFIRPDDFDLTP